ncbi:MAG: Serine/threonine protein kinase PrkC, regulator of stationary phase [Myxococcales bacterium]|nr:Serine/threonine protein kinase PrkC, regulator of stationary phase [Myxococcales bacterium]
MVTALPGMSTALELPPPGYQLGELIGRGGMGEVIAAHDQRIGREVAIKRMRAAHPDGEQLARFLREARIQARLDHPAIVPVHEMSTDEAGRPFFTMKRVSGRTLGERMAAGATQQTLLRAFIDVCLAIELAHSRAVIHRDLKPANIMMGDFGEVYVLDWGVARVLTDKTRAPSESDIGTLDEGTQTGALLGTPGFMSPEQIKGVPAMQPADVYALGAILFEILAGESLHPRGSAAISSTLSSPTDAPARRRSDRSVPPELDAVCVAALSEDPELRPSARELADRVQAYLDGDRDLDRRRKLAAEQLALAQDALKQGGSDARATAIRRAGRALALDPESTEAADLVTSLIVEPPPVLPPELIAELAVQERAVTKERNRAGFYAYASLFAFWPLIPFAGVKDWTWVLAFYAVISFLCYRMWRSWQTGLYNLPVALTANFVLGLLWTRIAGIFVLTPVLVCGVLLGLTSTSWVINRRWIVVVYTVAAFVTPALLESAGLFLPSWDVTQTAIISHSEMFAMSGRVGDTLLFFSNIAFVSIVGLIAIRMHGAAKQAKRTLYIQKWHMNHLLPTSPRRWATQR